MYAVEQDNMTIYKLLIENGADPTIKDSLGRNAYTYVKLNHPKSELVNLVKEDL